MAGPVSAFAARKANRTSTSNVDTGTTIVDSLRVDANDDIEALTAPRKRKRRGERPESLGIPQAGTNETTAFVPLNEPEIVCENGANASDLDTETVDRSSDFEGQPGPTAPARKLSTFVPAKSNILSETETQWTIRLNPDDNLALLGQYDIWVRSGAVSVLGAVLHASPKLHRVFAPSTHSIPSIKVVSNPYGTGNPPVEITIQSCSSRIRMLKHIAPQYGRIWSARQGPDDGRRSFINLQSSEDDPHKRPLHLLDVPSDWQEMVFRILANNGKCPAAIMVCGPKGAGKSTFCRILANALLSKGSATQREPNTVAFLDLDPGQPEFSPPGELSLLRLQCCILGPPFTHPTVSGDDQVVRAHHFGHLSPKEDPDHYYSCALDLYGHYQRISVDCGSCPLIVNCSGWIQGSASELLIELMRGLNLTDIVYMSMSGPEEVINVLTEAAIRTKVLLHQLNSQSSELSTRTAADLRVMQSISYFHLDEPEGCNLRWNPHPLIDVPPLVVHYAGPQQAIHAVMILGDEQCPDVFHSILDGQVISITVVESESAISTAAYQDGRVAGGSETGNESCSMDVTHDVNDFELEADCPQQSSILPRTSDGIPYIPAEHYTVGPLSPSNSYSLGQALIRGIDPQTHTFHLLTPVPSTKLLELQKHPHHKIVLVRGRLDTPTWAYAEELTFEREKARRRERELGCKEDFRREDIEAWAERQPWATIVNGGRSGSGKVRKVRRDIRYKGQAIGGSL